MTNQIGIRDEHSRGFIVVRKFSDRLARLNEQGLLVVFKPAQRTDNGIEHSQFRRPGRCRVNDQSIRSFRDFRIEIVISIRHGRFLGASLCNCALAHVARELTVFPLITSRVRYRIRRRELLSRIAAMSGARAGLPATVKYFSDRPVSAFHPGTALQCVVDVERFPRLPAIRWASTFSAVFPRSIVI